MQSREEEYTNEILQCAGFFCCFSIPLLVLGLLFLVFGVERYENKTGLVLLGISCTSLLLAKVLCHFVMKRERVVAWIEEKLQQQEREETEVNVTQVDV